MPLPFRSRLAPLSLQVEDNFNRPNQTGLGTTSDGTAAWQILSGSWSISNNQASTSTASSSNPIAYLDLGFSDIDASLDISSGGGDALYFRVVDQNNWWRVVNQVTTTSQDVYTNETEYQAWKTWEGYSYGYNCSCSTSSVTQCGSCPSVSAYSCYASWDGSTTGNGSAGCNENHTASTYNCTEYSTCSVYDHTNYYTNYYAYLDKMVNGTLTNVSSGSYSCSNLRVVAIGSTIKAYLNGALRWTVTDSSLQTATKHGIGRGRSSGGSALDNFVLGLATN